MDSDPSTEEKFWDEGEKKKLEFEAPDATLGPKKGNQVGIILLVSVLVVGIVGVWAFLNLDQPESDAELVDAALIQKAKQNHHHLSLLAAAFWYPRMHWPRIICHH